MNIDTQLPVSALRARVDKVFALAAPKIIKLQRSWDPGKGSPVFTREGKYTTRGWTEWTQGFQFGCQLLMFDATGDQEFFRLGRENTLEYMAPHVSHVGVHDHGFNNISTYGNLWRLAREGKSTESADAIELYELALKVSGAVQAARWSKLSDGTGFIHSFNGPHSLFSDTIRSCRVLSLAHSLGHCLMGENDQRISLLGRTVEHALNTAKYNVYYGEGRDAYDVRGRVAHESIFNMTDGRYRCPSTQQGYSPFTTWTRGLAWILLGYAEQLEFLKTVRDDALAPFGGRATIEPVLLKTAEAAADFYIDNTASDGVPYWDSGAPGLAHMPGHLDAPSQPDNDYEPVDSSAAVIAAQGLLRLGHLLGLEKRGKKYYQAGLAVARTVFDNPYISEDPDHQGLILHSVYHRPNGWDYIPEGKRVPQGESSMWGDYHALELALYLKRQIEGGEYLTFFDQPR
ncbi:MAG: glycoside hydrolase family 88 protein [Candidatus Hydrogenedentes bacterium]|nr:glycoside hydrolase family 88 protein [Candidatus Hydrogenedentota bacterium]